MSRTASTSPATSSRRSRRTRARGALMFLGADGVIEPRTRSAWPRGRGSWAARLREHGVRPGDRVAVVVGEVADSIEVMLAGMKIGAVTVPCSPSLLVRRARRPSRELRFQRSWSPTCVPAAEALESSGRATVVYVDAADDRLASSMSGEEPTHDTASRDLAFLLTTSGAGGGPAASSAPRGGGLRGSRHRPSTGWTRAPATSSGAPADTSSPLAVWLLLLGPWARGAEVVLHQGPFDPGGATRPHPAVRGSRSSARAPPSTSALAQTGEPTLARYLPDRLRRMVSTGDFLSPTSSPPSSRLGDARRGRLGADRVRRRSATARTTASTTAPSGTRCPATRSRSSTRVAASSRRDEGSSRCVAAAHALHRLLERAGGDAGRLAR